MKETYAYLLMAVMYSCVLVSVSMLAGCDSVKYYECLARDNTRNPCNQESLMPTALKNWKTTVSGLIPLVAYALNYFGLWPSIIPLPDFNQVWPFVLAIVGIGANAKDSNVTGGTVQQ